MAGAVYQPQPFEYGFTLLGWPKAKTKDFDKLVRDFFGAVAEGFEYFSANGIAYREFSKLFAGAASVCDLGSLGSEMQKTILAVRNWNPIRIFRHGQLVVAYTGSVVKFSSKFIAAVAPSLAPALPFIGVLNPACSIIPCAMTTQENLVEIEQHNAAWGIKNENITLPGGMGNTDAILAERKEFFAAKWNEKVADTVYQVVIIAMCFFSVTAFLASFATFASLSMATIGGYGFMALSGVAVTSALARFTFAEKANHHSREFGKCFSESALHRFNVTPLSARSDSPDYSIVGRIAVQA